MTITKQEVKTIYNIEINFNEYWDLLMKFGKFSTDEIMYQNLAEFLKTKSYEQRDEARKIFESFTIERWHSELVEYMIKRLGFDGVENFGSYNKIKKCYQCVVYNHGDYINR